MPTGRAEEIRYLREKAQQFRELAKTYKSDISMKLMEIAQDLDGRADLLERRELD
jgi:hypothetical protein